MPQWDWEEWHGLGSPERAAALAGRGEGGYRNAESDPSFPYIISACAGELLRQSNDADGCGGLFPSSCEPDDVRLLSNWSSPARRFSGTCACFPAGRHPAHFAAPDGSHFLAATNAGGSTLMTSSSATGPWESFYIVDLNGGRLMDHDAIQIRTWASNAACLGLGMSACGSTSGCLWTPFAAGGGSCNPGGYSLQAGAALGSSPNANCTSSVSCGGLAQWQIRHADGSPGRILDGQLVGLFNIGRGRFLSARDQGGSTLTTDQTFIGPWETFTYLEPRRALLVNVRAPDGTYARYDGVTSTLTTSALENEYDASGNARIEARQQSFWVVDHNGGALNYGDSVSFEWSLGPAEWSGCANGPGALSGDDVFTSQACERFAISACHGAATLCGNLTPQGQSACAAQQGCAWLNSACRDFPRVTDCSALTSQATCSTQRGCLFGGPIRHHDTVTLRVTGAGFVRQNGSQLQANANALSASSFMLDFAQGRAACTGSALCINQVDASSCTAHAGCTWGNACIGTATACGGLSGASCTAQSGCRLSGATCLGVAMTCTTRASASSCSAQAGCSWGNASRFQVY
jgi:hypothetical protein